MDRQDTLILQYGEQRFGVGVRRPRITVGRQKGNDLLIQDAMVSKRHATVFLEHGHFFLEDHSRNGTFLLTGRREVVHVKDSRQRLSGRGLIALGERPGTSLVLEIQFWTELPGELQAGLAS
ncbi:MAG: FHA domain-containing protein [Magnetococcales bacterium]|nr:FHA domain-containing protein [Magnetococcales bacterium]